MLNHLSISKTWVISDFDRTLSIESDKCDKWFLKEVQKQLKKVA